MTRCRDIINFMEKLAPLELAESWDNVGLMVGDFDMEVKKVLVALDIDDNVINEAIENNVNMIITHHPFIFGSIKNINSSNTTGKRAIKLIKNDIAVYSAHTNLDIAKNGTNDVLAKLLQLNDTEILLKSDDDTNGLGRVGIISNEMSFLDFSISLKEKLKMKNLTITGDTKKMIKKVGLCTGQCSGSEYMIQAKKAGCDVYVTGDLRYHEAQFANNLDLCVIDITHYGSEVLIVPKLCQYLNDCAETSNFNFVCIESKTNGQTLNII